MANVITNPGLESGTGSTSSVGYVNGVANRLHLTDGGAGMSVAFTTSVKHSGSQGGVMNGGTADAWHVAGYISSSDWASYKIPVSGSTTYYFSGWLKSVNWVANATYAGLYMYEIDSSGNYIGGTDVGLYLSANTQDWTEKTRSWTTNASATGMLMAWSRSHGKGGQVYSDDFSIDTTPPSTNYTKTFSETITISEPSFIKAVSKTFSETITLSETISKAFTKIFSDTVTLSEVFSTVYGRFKTFTESAITITDTIGKAITKTFSETITISETISKAITRIFTESAITISDTIVKSVSKTFSDAITLSEVLVKAITKTFTETITISETISKAITRTFTESAITITDTLGKSTSKIFNDVLTVTDNIGKAITKTFSETITLSETISKAITKTFTDTITITDLIEKLLNKIGRLPEYIRALVSPKPVGFMLEKDKPGIGKAGGVDESGGTFLAKDKPGIGIADSVDKPVRV